MFFFLDFVCVALLTLASFQVGGLPLAELNHLEIQFLVLNDFRLAVPVEDLEAYATMLVPPPKYLRSVRTWPESFRTIKAPRSGEPNIL